jgi:hypothetical protein
MLTSNQWLIATNGATRDEDQATASSRASHCYANFSPGAIDRRPEHPTPVTLNSGSHSAACRFLAIVDGALLGNTVGRASPPECQRRVNSVSQRAPFPVHICLPIANLPDHGAVAFCAPLEPWVTPVLTLHRDGAPISAPFASEPCPERVLAPRSDPGILRTVVAAHCANATV